MEQRVINMENVLILGSAGMAGHVISEYLSQLDESKIAKLRMKYSSTKRNLLGFLLKTKKERRVQLKSSMRLELTSSP